MGDLGKFIVAKGFKKFPKVQKIAKSGHTATNSLCDGISDGLLVGLRRVYDETVLLGHVRDPLIVDHDVQLVQVGAGCRRSNLLDQANRLFSDFRP